MTYTLLKFLGWGILLAVIGGCIGWALRALIARRDLASARTANVDEDELERMRHRLANLEQVVAERDRLRMQIADMRHTDSPGVVGAVPDDDLATATPARDDSESVTASRPPVAGGEARREPGHDDTVSDAGIPSEDEDPGDDGAAEPARSDG